MFSLTALDVSDNLDESRRCRFKSSSEELKVIPGQKQYQTLLAGS